MLFQYNVKRTSNMCRKVARKSFTLMPRAPQTCRASAAQVWRGLPCALRHLQHSLWQANVSDGTARNRQGVSGLLDSTGCCVSGLVCKDTAGPSPPICQEAAAHYAFSPGCTSRLQNGGQCGVPAPLPQPDSKTRTRGQESVLVQSKVEKECTVRVNQLCQ